MNRKALAAIGAWAFTIDLGVGDKPPTEFRIFASGKNTATKLLGSDVALFDDAAAKAVMGAYAKHGVDAMIDLEHLSLDPEAPNYDPDARGWCRLEVRNGELWAVDVKWTDDGAARLTGKRQRFVSPAFKKDPKTGRVTSIVNIALTALPATDNAAPLIAASRGNRGKMKYRNLIKFAALSSTDMKLAAQLMAAIEAAQGADSPDLKALAAACDQGLDKLLGNAPDAPDGSEPPGEAPPAPAPEESAAAAPAPAAPMAKPDDKKKPMPAAAPAPAAYSSVDAAAIVRAAQLATGKTDPREVEAAIVALGVAAVPDPSEVDELRAERERNETRELVRNGIAQGKVSPAKEATLLSMRPDEVRRVLELIPTRAKPVKPPAEKLPTAPEIALTGADIELCKLTGVSPETVLAQKKKDAARSAGGVSQ